MSLQFILSEAAATGAGSAISGPPVRKTYEACGRTSSGSGTAVVQIRGRNSPSAAWAVIGTITLALTASAGVNDASDSFSSEDRYAELSANVTSITGTGARVSVAVGF